VDDIRTMQARIDSTLIQRRSPALLAGIFASVALLLTAIGTYGVVAYAVSQRSREIGVRMALGAMPQQVLTHFLGISTKLLLVGLFLGVVGAWALGRVMENFLFGVGAIHAGVLVTTIAVMILVVLLACLIPARRAAKTDPMEALRYE
jgi:ABC-type antimicrobial peptide transport system permease subunit